MKIVNKILLPITLIVLGCLSLVYWWRGYLAGELQQFIFLYIDKPHYYPSSLNASLPKALNSKKDMEQWLLATALCAHRSILDVQSPIFKNEFKKLGAKIISGDEYGDLDGQYKLPPGIKIFGLNAISMQYWVDSGSDISIELEGDISEYAESVGAKPAFFRFHAGEVYPVLFGEKFNLFEKSELTPDGYFYYPPSTYFIGGPSGSSVGCRTHDG